MSCRDKSKLVGDLRRAVGLATKAFAMNGVALPALEALPAKGFERVGRIDDAVNALIAPDTLSRAYTTEVYKEKCVSLFEHFYESYPEREDNGYRAG